MLSVVRKLTDTDFDVFLNIYHHAYPGELTELNEERLNQIKTRWILLNNENPDLNFYGCFREDKLVGGMLLFDFTMNIFSNMMEVGGVGMVCVDLLYKKEHVAKDLMEFFHNHYYSRGSCVTTLYPFRPDFYINMGYGLGMKINQYSFTANSARNITQKKHIRYLTMDDKIQLLEFYNHYGKKIHGMILRSERGIQRLLGSYKVIGFTQNGSIKGYLAFRFKKGDPDNFIINDLVIEEFLYENPTVFQELMTFIHSQFDQIRKIIYNTFDNDFHFSLSDPRNGSPTLFRTSQETNISGVGIMYRIINAEKLFQKLKNHNFGDQTLTLKMNIDDDFFPPNSRSLIIAFKNGMPEVKSNSTSFDVETSINVSNFSSLIMGAVPFKKLHNYGLVTISDENFIDDVNKLFQCETPPITLEQF